MNKFLILLMLSFSQLLFAEAGGWISRDGKPVPNHEEIKSIDGFGGWLVVTPDTDWEEKWQTSPETIPHFTNAKDVSYGEQLTILPFYINPKTNSAGDVNVLCDIKVTRPDGSHAVNEKSIKCVEGKLQGNPRNVRLTSMIIKYIAEDNDIPGAWMVEVNLTDKNRGTKIPLKTQFNLLVDKSKKDTRHIAKNQQIKITTADEFSYFIQTYYLNPQPDLIDSAIKYLESSDLASNKNAQSPLLMSFSCLFSQYDSTHKKRWSDTIDNLGEPTKALLNRSIKQEPGQILSETAISPSKNDMNWSCFFATGDNKYLNNIISTLKYMGDRKDLNLFLTAASAKWSLSSNAESHSKIRQVIETVYPNPDSILGIDPYKIREEMMIILKEQKKNGVWK